MPTTVVNIKDSDCDVYIGRGSKWGNPFRIGKNGSREEVIEKYKEWLMHTEALLANLCELKDKVLGCHCKPLPCHGDVLVELVNSLD